MVLKEEQDELEAAAQLFHDTSKQKQHEDAELVDAVAAKEKFLTEDEFDRIDEDELNEAKARRAFAAASLDDLHDWCWMEGKMGRQLERRTQAGLRRGEDEATERNVRKALAKRDPTDAFIDE